MFSSVKSKLLSTSAILLMSACSVQTTALSDEQLRKAATSELSQIFAPVQAVNGEVNIQDAVQRSVINNLENRLQRLEQSYASRQVDVDSLDMLPVLAANAGYTRRSNDGYSTSQPLGSPMTGAYSRGSDDQIRTTDLSVSWNVLDFAVGYFNAQQAGNRALIAEERARRAGMDVIRQAKDSYWRAYAAQALSGRVSNNIAEAESVLSTIREGERSGAIPAMQALEQSRSVLESIRQLEIVRQELSQARLMLSQMINVPPGQSVALSSRGMTVPIVSENLASLEEQAYLRNPAIREQQYRTQIALSDVKKTTAELFPNISANAQMNFSSDDFLRQSEWNSFGLSVGMNLLRLATAPGRRGLAQDGVNVEQARALAVRMAVLAQTHIAYRDYQFALQQFNRSREIEEVEASIAEQSRAREVASTRSQAQRVLDETGAILSKLRVYRSYADLLSAHETLQATVGADDELVDLIAEQRRLLETATVDVATAETTISELRSSIPAQERAIATLQRDVENAQSDVVNALTDLQTAQTDLTEAQNAQTEAEAAYSAVQLEFDSLQSSAAEATENIDQLIKAGSELDESIAVASSNLSALQRQLREVTGKVRSAGRDSGLLQRRIARLHKQADRFEVRIAALVEDIEQRNNEAYKQKLQDSLSSVEAKFAFVQSEIVEAQAQLELAQGISSNDSTNLTGLQALADTQKAELSSLEQRRAALRAELRHAENGQRDIERSLAAADRDVMRLQKAFDEAIEETSMVTVALAQATEATELTQSIVADMTAQRAAAEVLMEQMIADLARAQADLGEAQERVDYYGAS